MKHEAWKRYTDWPLALLSLAFLAAYSTEVIGDLTGKAASICELIMTIVWIAFALDYIVNLILVKNKKRWVLTHLHDLVIVAVPLFRPLRLLRVLSLFAMLHRAGSAALRTRIGVYVAVSVLLLVYVTGVAVLDAEQHAHGANITNIGNAWWWAFTTLTTVGYGDYYPVTLSGRLVAVLLMAGGIFLLGTVTALVTSWMVDQVRKSNNVSANKIIAEVEEK